jgi:hypothetical protein
MAAEPSACSDKHDNDVATVEGVRLMGPIRDAGPTP